MNKSLYGLVLFSVFIGAVMVSCKSSQAPAIPQNSKTLRIAFYNVENLFDTIDAPVIKDEEFTPQSDKMWNTQRYERKLKHIAEVIDSMGRPVLMGLAEVENKTVLEDLIAKTSLKKSFYTPIHFDSPDPRGIDVALLYDSTRFRPFYSVPIQVKIPSEIRAQEDSTTRDLLLTEGVLLPASDTISIIVCHLPSRTGGQMESEPRRMYVARRIRGEVKRIMTYRPNTRVLVMGDFNDEPTDMSLSNILSAVPLDSSESESKLYNCSWKTFQSGQGSYKYKGQWNMLDNILISSALRRDSRLTYLGFEVYQRRWMMYQDPNYGLAPDRTYGGKKYFGGYSDHLPVYVDFKYR